MSNQPQLKIWSCKIGEVRADLLPDGSDWPMREAIREAYEKVTITGQPADFIFSGWGGRLTEGERAVHEDRAPDHAKVCTHPEDCPGCERTEGCQECAALRAQLAAVERVSLVVIDELGRYDVIGAHRLRMELRTALGGTP